MAAEEQKAASKSKVNFSIDLRLIILVLLAVIVAMLLAWKPWSSSGLADRTVTVTGQATISAEPDEYVFYPSYEFTGANQDTALTALSKKSNEIVAKVKELGVQDSQIKTNASGYNFPVVRKSPDSDVATYTLQLTITVNNKELAQKVQDYLLTTSPTGTVSPQANFSDAKRKELEAQARDEATKDARAKAEQSAKNLGFKVGKVRSVTDGVGFGEVMPLGREGTAPTMAQDTKTQLSIQPGQNDLSYSVSVIFYVK